MSVEKWQLAQSLIDAKKIIDSLIYISENIKSVSNLNIHSKIKSMSKEFYIHLCVILDRAFLGKKKSICETDEIVERIYYERDKNSAHKDKNYRRRQYKTLDEEIVDKKKEMIHVMELCKEVLPDNITLDFVPHDRDLFRQIHNISPKDEEIIKKLKHPGYGRTSAEDLAHSKTYQVLHDIDDIKYISENDLSQYCVVVECGLNTYEGVQNRQDACIRINVMYNKNIWVTTNYKAVARVQKMKELRLLNEYEIPQHIDENNEEARAFIEQMMREYDINK